MICGPSTCIKQHKVVHIRNGCDSKIRMVYRPVNFLALDQSRSRKHLTNLRDPVDAESHKLWMIWDPPTCIKQHKVGYARNGCSSKNKKKHNGLSSCQTFWHWIQVEAGSIWQTYEVLWIQKSHQLWIIWGPPTCIKQHRVGHTRNGCGSNTKRYSLHTWMHSLSGKMAQSSSVSNPREQASRSCLCQRSHAAQGAGFCPRTVQALRRGARPGERRKGATQTKDNLMGGHILKSISCSQDTIDWVQESVRTYPIEHQDINSP